MPLATDEEVAKFTSDYGPIRLGCRGMCFRDDYDGVRLLPGDWKNIEEVQTLRASLSVYETHEDDDPPPGFDLMDWETHKGWCPDCEADD